MENYRAFLKALRRESKEMQIRIPRDPPSQSKEYRYFKRFINCRMKGSTKDNVDDSIDESIMSDEQPSLSMGGPSPSTMRSNNSPSKMVTPKNEEADKTPS